MSTLNYSIPEAQENVGDKTESCIFRFFCWFFQILIWLNIAIIIIFYIIEKINFLIISLIVFHFSYLLYMIFEFLSPTSVYLLHKNSGIGIYEKMKEIFRSHPEIKFHIQCYHTAEVRHTITDDDGNDRGYYYTTETVYTHSASDSFPCYCSRDVSGLFYLKYDKNLIKKKYFIKLKLKEEIGFADYISQKDYESYKNDFIKKNDKDDSMDFKETKKIPGLDLYNLVNIRGKIPCTVNYFFYFLSIIFTVCQFYKSYVDSLCITQCFTIKKIISTREDLSQPKYEEKYASKNPSLNLIIKQYLYEPNDYNYLNPDGLMTEKKQYLEENSEENSIFD